MEAAIGPPPDDQNVRLGMLQGCDDDTDPH